MGRKDLGWKQDSLVGRALPRRVEVARTGRVKVGVKVGARVDQVGTLGVTGARRSGQHRGRVGR